MPKEFRYIVLIAPVLLTLSGCVTTRPIYYDSPPQTISGYDPGLRSHREVIRGLK